MSSSESVPCTQAVRQARMARKRTRTNTEDNKEEGDILVSKEGSSAASSSTPAKSRRSGRLSGGTSGEPLLELKDSPKSSEKSASKKKAVEDTVDQKQQGKRRKAQQEDEETAGAVKVEMDDGAAAEEGEGAEEEAGEEDEAKPEPTRGGVRGHAGLSAFELERMENIRKNQEVLRALGIDTSRAEMRAHVRRPTAKPAKRKAPSEKAEKPEPAIGTRRSTRGSGLPAPDYTSEKVVITEDAHVQEERMDQGPLTLETLNRSDESGEEFLSLLRTLLAESENGEGKGEAKRVVPKKATLDYASRLATLTLVKGKEDYQRMTNERTTSMVVHPSEDKIIVVAADRFGHLGLWDVSSPPGKGLYQFRPHIDKVASMQYKPDNVTKLLSTSHDGTVRNLDFNKEVFDLVVATGDGIFEHSSGLTCGHMTARQPESLLLCGENGEMGMFDLRSHKAAWAVMDGHDKKCNSIEGHPGNDFNFVTAGLDRVVKFWDSRKVKKAVWTMDHPLSLNNATFNPTGQYLVTTCQNHYVYVFEDAAQLSGDLDLKTTALHSIRHNNHTGRWLSKFWPTWDPKEPSAFVIGSMEQPRRIEVFSAESGIQLASIQHELMASVQSINVFHPTLNMLFTANSSGRVHCWRGD